MKSKYDELEENTSIDTIFMYAWAIIVILIIVALVRFIIFGVN